MRFNSNYLSIRLKQIFPVWFDRLSGNKGYAKGTAYGNWRENGEYGSAERIGMT